LEGHRVILRVAVLGALSAFRDGLSCRHMRSTMAALLLSACVYDDGERCDPGQVLYDELRCVCAPGLALGPNGCVPCGEHEVAGESGCVCADGYSRASAEATCEPVVTDQGNACSAEMPCTDAVYNHCEASGGNGYCTNTGCTTSADCAGGYACDTVVSPTICRRPPLGANQSCATSADCAGTEATFCDAVITHSCRVEGCSLAPDNCFEGTECCDLSGFGVPLPICVAQGGCP
jgi:hypothetical protein